MNEQLKTEIGLRISSLRFERKLTRERLAEKAEISTQFLSDIESGKKGMTANTLYKLCKALCISSDFLLFGVCDNSSHISEMIKILSDEQKKDAEELLNIFISAVTRKQNENT